MGKVKYKPLLREAANQLAILYQGRNRRAAVSDNLYAIELRLLSSLSLEDAEFLCQMFGLDYSEVSIFNSVCTSVDVTYLGGSFTLYDDGDIIFSSPSDGDWVEIVDYLFVYQYLQAVGYALPYRGWTVEELVKHRVYHIKD